VSVTTERLRGLIETMPTELPPLTVELVRDLDIAEHLAIADVAALTGLSPHTLRYYERIGLVDVARDASGRRTYDRDAVGRVVFITRLRDLEAALAVVDYKITTYGGACGA
jgi:MerR family regulatory protein